MRYFPFRVLSPVDAPNVLVHLGTLVFNGFEDAYARDIRPSFSFYVPFRTDADEAVAKYSSDPEAIRSDVKIRGL